MAGPLNRPRNWNRVPPAPDEQTIDKYNEETDRRPRDKFLDDPEDYFQEEVDE